MIFKLIMIRVMVMIIMIMIVITMIKNMLIRTNLAQRLKEWQENILDEPNLGSWLRHSVPEDYDEYHMMMTMMMNMIS